MKARSEIRASNGWQTGSGLALAGIILGVLAVLVSIVAIVVVVVALASGESTFSTTGGGRSF